MSSMINPEIWTTPPAQRLTSALLEIKDATTLQRFLRDLMTESEIIEICARFEAAKLLSEGAKYTDITQYTRLSSRTVARISDWSQNGTGGYAAALNLINHHSHSTSQSGEA